MLDQVEEVEDAAGAVLDHEGEAEGARRLGVDDRLDDVRVAGQQAVLTDHERGADANRLLALCVGLARRHHQEQAFLVPGGDRAAVGGAQLGLFPQLGLACLELVFEAGDLLLGLGDHLGAFGLGQVQALADVLHRLVALLQFDDQAADPPLAIAQLAAHRGQLLVRWVARAAACARGPAAGPSMAASAGWISPWVRLSSTMRASALSQGWS